jgi:hypothetical protein
MRREATVVAPDLRRVRGVTDLQLPAQEFSSGGSVSSHGERSYKKWILLPALCLWEGMQRHLSPIVAAA